MKSMSCAIVDYGIGNVFSVAQAMRKCGAEVNLTADRAEIMAADRVILPGVGAFGRAIDTLREMGLEDTLKEFIATERPFLGICVGMQVLMDVGLEFGSHRGFGLFPGKVAKINIVDGYDEKLRVPLIGWNTPMPTAPGRWEGTPLAAAGQHTDYYFVHSFAVQADNPTDVAATVPVGAGHVTAAIHRDNIIGVQFHPERSAAGGLAFLNGFMTL